MRQLLTLSSNMEQAIAGSALRGFCELAKVDHLLYKFRVYKVLFGISDENKSQFASHTICRLGKWYTRETGKPASPNCRAIGNLKPRINGFMTLPSVRCVPMPSTMFR